MIDNSNTPMMGGLDKMMEITIINNMMEITNMASGALVIELIHRIAKSKHITYQHLAKLLNVNRQTVSARFNNHTMDIEDYINTAQAIGANPADILQQAINIHNQQAESALTGKEKQ